MSSKTTEKRGAQKPRCELAPPYAYTDGDDAARLVSAYGFTLDPWQKDVLDAWLGRDTQDRFTSTACGLSVPRQNGKNALLEARELYGLCCNGEKFLHTAHEVKTARKAFLRLCSFFENDADYPELAEMVVSIRRTNGQEAIVLDNGGSIEFSARSKSAARGFTVDTVVFDEAQELTEEQIEAILPTLAAAPSGNRQVIYTGTPPTPLSVGAIFSRIRTDALTNTDSKLCWHEWSVEDPKNIEDKSLWYQTNPALGYRLEESFIENEMKTLSQEGFARERLGWWEEGAGKFIFTADEWDKTNTTDVIEGKTAFAVKFSPDGACVALAAAVLPDKGKPCVEVIECKSLNSGVSWLADWIAERKDKMSAVCVDGLNGAAVLNEKLAGRIPRRAHIAVKAADVISASNLFVQGIKQAELLHFEQDLLRQSALSVIRRNIGNNGGFGFDGELAAPLEACALAFWAVKTTRRNPSRKQRIS